MSWELLIHWKNEGVSQNKAVLVRIVSVSAESEKPQFLSMAKTSIVQVRVEEVGLTNWSLTKKRVRLGLEDHWTLSAHIDPDKCIH